VADRVRDTAQAVVPVDDVVGNGDDVVAAPAEEIHDLRKRQVAVRVGRVHVKVAEQHLRHPFEFWAGEEKPCRKRGKAWEKPL
jgi:hypothetical protein